MDDEESIIGKAIKGRRDKAEIQRAGEIRYIGVSNFSVEQLKEALKGIKTLGL